MNDFTTCNEIGSIYQDILSRELLNYGIVIQCHTSKFMQLNYGENPQGIEIKHDSKIVETNNIFFEFSAINKKGECVLAKMGILYCMDCNIYAQEEDLDKEVEVEV